VIDEAKAEATQLVVVGALRSSDLQSFGGGGPLNHQPDAPFAGPYGDADTVTIRAQVSVTHGIRHDLCKGELYILHSPLVQIRSRDVRHGGARLSSGLGSGCDFDLVSREVVIFHRVSNPLTPARDRRLLASYP
jgi:hypothetical protein